MRPLFFLFLMFVCFSFASGGNNDSLQYKYAILFDHDGSVIDQYGLKYRVSQPISLFLRFRVDFYKRDSNLPGVLSSDGSSFESKIGFEYKLAQIDRIDLFASLFGGYAVTKFSSDWALQQFTKSTKVVGLIIGVGLGVEYHILDQWSLSGNHILQVDYADTEETTESGTYNSTNTAFRIPISKLTLTFYF